MRSEVKCEQRLLVFQRTVLFHGINGPLPTDGEAKALAREDETLVETRGGSHMEVVEVPDPPAETLAEALAKAQAQVEARAAAVAAVSEETISSARLLLATGRKMDDVAGLVGVPVDVLTQTLGG